MKNIGIILSGGIGQRMGYNIPKQYIQIDGREIISFSIEEFRNSKSLDGIIVVADSAEHALHIEKTYGAKTILGGRTRNESFYNALSYIHDNGGCDNVFVNEAARPMITAGLIDEFLGMMDGSISCIYCTKPITDSLETEKGEYSDRTAFRLVMSPEAYDFSTIWKYFHKDSVTTFPGHDIPNTFKKIQYTKYTNNIKITYPLDLALLNALLNERDRGQ